MTTPFTDAALQFFAELSFHNERAWFMANKPRYEADVLVPLREYVVEASEACSALGLPLRGDPVGTIYRIHRDVRFSADKTPYKTHAGVLLTRDGIKHGEGILYLHVDPHQSFFAVGFYEPRKELLDAFRKEMVNDPDSWLELEKSLPEWRSEGSLSRIPRGYEAHKGTPLEASLKLKSFVISHPLSPEELFDPKLPEIGAKFALANRKLLDWGWKVRDTIGNYQES